MTLLDAVLAVGALAALCGGWALFLVWSGGTDPEEPLDGTSCFLCRGSCEGERDDCPHRRDREDGTPLVISLERPTRVGAGGEWEGRVDRVSRQAAEREEP